MELDDLKIAWAELGQRAAALETIVWREHRARRLDGIRRPLRLLGAGQFLQSLFWIGVVATVAPFWIEHRHVPHYRLADRPARSPWLQRMIDDAAGRSLSRAARELGEIEAFERE